MATDPHHNPRTSHGDDGAGPLNHEPTDISLEGIGKLTIGFVIILLVDLTIISFLPWLSLVFTGR